MTNTEPSTEIDEQVLKDLVVTAVEGGISYWASTSAYNPDAGTATIHDTVEESPDPLEINLDVIRHGLTLLAADRSLAPRFHDQAVAMFADEETDFDADTADVVVQLGLFEEVVYG